MNDHVFPLAGTTLHALGSGALWWPEARLLCVSDLHLGKSERHARRGGASLPPYETRDTLARLAADLDRTGARQVVCLGDSFDDDAAADALPDTEKLWLLGLQAGRSWIWIAGNHDPSPADLGGTHRVEYRCGPLTFRHVAQPGAAAEVSGHYHPKARVQTRARMITRPAFLADAQRVILPAYGTYTGGLSTRHAALTALMQPDALAILTGPRVHALPMPR
jgi:DNA ligase-associated metallophosphoesterase